MNCPLQKLLMEMVFDTPNSPQSSPQNQDSETAVAAPRRMDVAVAATAGEGRKKGPEAEKKEMATCIDDDPCCAMLLGHYIAFMKTKDIEAFRNKLRKLAR